MDADKKIDRCLTAPVTVVEGCVCSDDTPWHYCACPNVMTYEYLCLCHNYADVLDGSNSVPSDTPAVKAVAQLIKKHPVGRFLYQHSNSHWDPKYGHGDHFALAQKASKDL